MRVLVVGLNPSKLNGTKSGSIRKLNQWLQFLQVNTVSFTNLYESYEIKNQSPIAIKDVAESYDKVLALGKTVSDHLSFVGISHYRLPHPSGLNRKLNDKKFVDEQLNLCKNYLRGCQ